MTVPDWLPLVCHNWGPIVTLLGFYIVVRPNNVTIGPRLCGKLRAARRSLGQEMVALATGVWKARHQTKTVVGVAIVVPGGTE